MRYVSKENLSQFWGGVKSWLNDKFTITKNKITDWPSTFPPSSHTHTISQITDLQNQLNGKLFFNPTVEYHYQSDTYTSDYTMSDMAVGEVKSVSICMKAANSSKICSSLYIPKTGGKYYVGLFSSGDFADSLIQNKFANGVSRIVGDIYYISAILNSGACLFTDNNITFGLIIRLS